MTHGREASLEEALIQLIKDNTAANVSLGAGQQAIAGAQSAAIANQGVIMSALQKLSEHDLLLAESLKHIGEQMGETPARIEKAGVDIKNHVSREAKAGRPERIIGWLLTLAALLVAAAAIMKATGGHLP